MSILYSVFGAEGVQEKPTPDQTTGQEGKERQLQTAAQQTDNQLQNTEQASQVAQAVQEVPPGEIDETTIEIGKIALEHYVAQAPGLFAARQILTFGVESLNEESTLKSREAQIEKLKVSSGDLRKACQQVGERLRAKRAKIDRLLGR